MTIWNQKATSTALACQARLTPLQAEAALDSLAVLINRKIKDGDTVIIDGLGVFEPMVLDGKVIQFTEAAHK
jgi:nucleoid DNA-binding protein